SARAPLTGEAATGDTVATPGLTGIGPMSVNGDRPAELAVLAGRPAKGSCVPMATSASVGFVAFTSGLVTIWPMVRLLKSAISIALPFMKASMVALVCPPGVIIEPAIL